MIGTVREVFKQTTIPYRTDVKGSALTTFRIGGACPLVIEPQCEGELIEAVRICRSMQVPFAVIGRGSNLLLADGALEHVLIRTCALNAMRFTRHGMVAQSGCMLSRLARLAAEQGLSDLVFAAGIPGTLGGAIFMNAGAYGGEIGPYIKSATVLDVTHMRVLILSGPELGFAYRKSALQETGAVVLSAELVLSAHADPVQICTQMHTLAQKRRETQPLHLPSAGSVFRRADSGESMGKVIDELGMKGMRCGNAAVSELHAGFIVNLGGASATDVQRLIVKIQENVERTRGFLPIPEIRYIP